MSTTPPTALAEEALVAERFLQAAEQCLLSAEATRLTMGEVAAQAGMSRASLYRYFPTKDDLLLALVVRRVEAYVPRLLAALPDPHAVEDALAQLVLSASDAVPGDPVNEALFHGESRSRLFDLELASDAVVDTMHRHLGPLLARWQRAGRLHDDLDLREVTRWLNTVALLLLQQPYCDRSRADRVAFVQRHVVRALVPPPSLTA